MIYDVNEHYFFKWKLLAVPENVWICDGRQLLLKYIWKCRWFSSVLNTSKGVIY